MLHIRPAVPSDLDFVVAGNLALAKESENLTLDETILREGVRALLEARTPGAYWIAELDGTAVGQTLITYEWSDWHNRMVWWIQSVYVSPGARQHGVFRGIYAHLRGAAAARDAADELRQVWSWIQEIRHEQ